MSVLVLGAGNFGTCLAQQLGRNQQKVFLWDRTKAVVESINSNRKNPKYLKKFELNENVEAVFNLSDFNYDSVTAVVICVPVQAIREVLSDRIPDGKLTDKTIICASKGLEITSGKLPFGVISECLGSSVEENICILSGPSFAIEVMQEFPTAVSCAAKMESSALEAQKLFHSPFFRVYTNPNPIGLELAGAMKNVIAIAAGAAAGLGFQANTSVALITRGLAEIIRIGAALGVDANVFTGLGGVGDLILTCTSEKSRNFTVGHKLGQGMTFEETMNSMTSVAEGVYTAKAAKKVVDKHGIDAPITRAVYEVLYNDVPVPEAMNMLINREAKAEA